MPEDNDYYEEVDETLWKKRPPLTERTDTKGLFKFAFPWIGGNVTAEWPATNRSAMVSIGLVCSMIVVVLPLCCYLIFVEASAENLERFGSMISRRDDSRKPEKIPVHTDDGIEIIEVCPPCELEDCNCPDCPMCPPPPVCQCMAPSVPEKIAPVDEPTI